MEKLKSLDEVCQEMHEERLGVFKEFTPQNHYFPVSLRDQGHREPVQLNEGKLRATLSFRGTNQPISFGYFKSIKGYNSKYKNNKEYADHYGEYIACIILKQLGKKSCKVDLGTLDVRNRFNNKVIKVDGILSHFQLSQEEVFRPICAVVESYAIMSPKKYKELTERGKTHSSSNNTNIEIILASIEDLLTKENQSERIPEIRKKFFDMCIFDLKFANRDRHDDNFGLKVNQATNEIDFYPLFDNEQILGFQENRPAAKAFSENDDDYERFRKRELTSYIGVPGKTLKITSKELLEYLLEHYYEETMNSINDIGRYKLENLNEVMEICPGLSEEHKELARKIFIAREKEIADVVKAHNEKRKNDELSL